MVGYSQTTGTITGNTVDSDCSYHITPDDFYVTTTGTWTPEIEVEDIIIDTKIESYIEKILKLTKWYIIYMFNCFMIRAPC